jgi:hypothetical protein
MIERVWPGTRKNGAGTVLRQRIVAETGGELAPSRI